MSEEIKVERRETKYSQVTHIDIFGRRDAIKVWRDKDDSDNWESVRSNWFSSGSHESLETTLIFHKALGIAIKEAKRLESGEWKPDKQPDKGK